MTLSTPTIPDVGDAVAGPQPSLFANLVTDIAMSDIDPTSGETFDLQAASNPDEDFTLFPKLPTEMRLKIWKFTTPTDRVIAITDKRYKLEENGPRGKFYAVISARYAIPAAMQACQEARTELMKQYTPILKEHLGDAVPFNFQHDTLLMDGPDGATAFWSFEKAGRKNSSTRKELAMIHNNLKHLAVQGSRVILRTINESLQFTNLETLALPSNPYWSSPNGHVAFNWRITERIRLHWTNLKANTGGRGGGRVWSETETSTDDKDENSKNDTNLAFQIPMVPRYNHFLKSITSGSTDYSNIDCTTHVMFFTEEDLKARLASSTRVTLSYIDGPDHPAMKERQRKAFSNANRTEAATPSSFSSSFDSLPNGTMIADPIFDDPDMTFT
ncbi:uncharacterized protein PAC_02448 [Phialocephala subalpina]|uniref:2EXR domain-containing protein n=1 Tax=Phialocephala subalpina TaxID=576137 RepID=A0A1L7WIH8_9HELO|nr:uncharacterized protein PAC_02448 [Phialocephala subalpina]